MLLSNTSEDIHNSYSRVTSAIRSLAVAIARPLYPEPGPVGQNNQHNHRRGVGAIKFGGDEGLQLRCHRALVFPRLLPFKHYTPATLGKRGSGEHCFPSFMLHQLSSGSWQAALTLDCAQRERHNPAGRTLLQGSCHARIHRHTAHVVSAACREWEQRMALSSSEALAKSSNLPWPSSPPLLCDKAPLLRFVAL